MRAQSGRMDTRIRFFSEGIPVIGVLGTPGGADERRPAVVVNHGLSGLKEMWIPQIAAALEDAGYVTLRFDYRHFGESGGEPRYRQLPLRQVEDVLSAVTFLESQPAVDPDRIGVFGLATGGAIAMYAAALDARIRCAVLLEAPADTERVFRRAAYDSIIAKARAAKRRFVLTGEAPTMSWAHMWRHIDPQVFEQVKTMEQRFERFSSQITEESFVDFWSFRPEAVVDRIAPRAVMWIHARNDERVLLFEAESAFAKAGEPKKLVVLDGPHSIYFSTALSTVIENAISWFDEHLRSASGPRPS